MVDLLEATLHGERLADSEEEPRERRKDGCHD
jgi:hypothetical protein